MNPQRRADDDFVWPPSEEDLEAIAVIELRRPAPSAPPAEPAREGTRVADAAAGDVTAQPAPVQVAGAPSETTQILELDAHGGSESYVVDLRPVEPPRQPTPPIVEPAIIEPPGIEPSVIDAVVVESVVVEPAVVRPAVIEPAVVEPAVAELSGVEPGASSLVWPPPEEDLDAIEVVELPPRGAPVEVHDLPPETPPLLVHPAAAPAVEPQKHAAEVLVPLPEAEAGPVEAAPIPKLSQAASAVSPRPSKTPFTRIEPAAASSVDVTSPVAPRSGAGARAVTFALAAGLVAGGGWLAYDRMWRSSGPVTNAGPSEANLGSRPATPNADPVQEETAEVTPVGSDRPALAGVREALAGGDRLLAMDLLTTYVGGGGGDPVAAALADQVLVAARTEAERQRRAATARLGGVPAGDAMNTARRREAMGQEAWRAGQYGAALRAFLGAQEGYSRVQSSTPEAIAALPEPPAPVALPPPPTAAPTAPTTLPASGATATAVPPASASRPPVAVPPSPAPAPSIDAPRPVSTPDPARSETSAADAASPSTGGADAGVRRALRAYQSAYETLDAGAAAAVYPAVDARALGRAFDGLRSQKLDFERCDVTGVTGDRAQATCLGRLAFVPRVGSQTPKVEARRWTFVLQRQGDAWRIQQAQVGPR